MIQYNQGDRVNTPHGPGTVAGFEAFDDKGRNVEPSTTDNGRRVIVQLDDPSAWPAHTVATTPPHYFRDEVTRATGHTIYNADRSRRVVYHPEWSKMHPWVSYTNGTAGRHFKTEKQARDWLTN